MTKKVIVIGGGIAGMEASAYLSAMGYHVTLIEKEQNLGGKLLNWEQLFPTKRKGSDVLEFLKQGVNKKVEIITGAVIQNIEKRNNQFTVYLKNESSYTSNALLICTGYELFDATRKEEYGYGIYENVITSADLEKVFSVNKSIVTPSGNVPKRIGFIHCVGSRDEKAGIPYCSKVCCVTAVKQAIEVKEINPSIEVFCFYMDLRMFGMRFENMYKEAQEKWGINFIRGRLSEACENKDKSILLKAEDTLLGKQLKMSVDLLVLMVGFLPSAGTVEIGKMLNLQFNEFGFLKIADEHTMTNVSSVPGIFLAGTCTSAKTIESTITDARAAAAKVAGYLEGYNIEERLMAKNSFF